MNNIKMTPAIHYIYRIHEVLVFVLTCKLITCMRAVLLDILMVCFTFPSVMWTLFN